MWAHGLLDGEDGDVGGAQDAVAHAAEHAAQRAKAAATHDDEVAAMLLSQVKNSQIMYVQILYAYAE